VGGLNELGPQATGSRGEHREKAPYYGLGAQLFEKSPRGRSEGRKKQEEKESRTLSLDARQDTTLRPRIQWEVERERKSNGKKRTAYKQSLPPSLSWTLWR